MEKYYGIEVRIARKIGMTLDPYFFSDGYIKIEDDRISGCMCEEYIEGKVDNSSNKANITVYRLKSKGQYMYLDKEKFVIQEFYLPSTFTLEKDNEIWELWIQQPEKFPGKKMIIDQQINIAKSFKEAHL